MAKLTDNSAAVMSRFDKASRDGVTAAANVLVRELKRNHRTNYTSQRFKQGEVGQSIVKSNLERDGDGYTMSVGTRLMYPLYWELGHHNLFTRKYERVRIWEPTFLSNLFAIRKAFATVVARTMGVK